MRSISEEKNILKVSSDIKRVVLPMIQEQHLLTELRSWTIASTCQCMCHYYSLLMAFSMQVNLEMADNERGEHLKKRRM